MARLERLAAPLLEQISLAGEQLEDEIGARIYGDALIHAANFSLIVLFGDPQIDEPVSSAWERCCKSDSPMLFNKFSNANRLKDFGSPFDHRARWCAQYFRECAGSAGPTPRWQHLTFHQGIVLTSANFFVLKIILRMARIAVWQVRKYPNVGYRNSRARTKGRRRLRTLG